jgi:hypothetical protein
MQESRKVCTFSSNFVQFLSVHVRVFVAFPIKPISEEFALLTAYFFLNQEKTPKNQYLR